MARKIEVTKRDGTHLGYLTRFSDPLLFEAINGQYTFSFTAYVDENLDLINEHNHVKIGGELFEMALISKEREKVPTIKVLCEHDSYKLIADRNRIEDYTDSPANILQQIVKYTGFEAGRVEFYEDVYFKPGMDKSRRETIIELAKFLGGELLWQGKSVHILRRRGTDKGLQFEVGVNLRAATFEIDGTSELADDNSGIFNEARRTLAADVIDLTEIPEHADFMSEVKRIELGDKVRVVDDLLDINHVERVVTYERDPFNPVLPRLTIGNVPRDIFDYIREETEKDEEPEEEDTAIYFKGSGLFMADKQQDENSPAEVALVLDFLAGDTQILNAPGADVTDEYRDGAEMNYSTVYVGKPEDKITLRLSEGLLDVYEVNVFVGNTRYTNADFRKGLLVVEGHFPDDVEVYISDGPPTPETIVKAYGANVLVKAQEYDGYDGLWIEFGKTPLDAVSQFNFSKRKGYEEVISVSYGLTGDVGISKTISVILSEVKKGGKVIGIKSMGNWGGGKAPPLDVNIIAVCREEVGE